MPNTSTDILIIGGGIAGCIAAIALSERYNVLLIDKDEEPSMRIGESLAPAAWRILKKLNLVKDMGTELYKQNIGMQSYWGSDQAQIVDHLNNPDGHVMSLNRQAFEAYLRKMAQQHGVICDWGTKFDDGQLVESVWQIRAHDKAESFNICADFVLDATGRQSHFARKLGIKRHHIDKLVACWATLANNQSNAMSTVLSCRNGWWYSVVLPNNKRVLAFHTDSDVINRRMMDDKQAFVACVREHSSLKKLMINVENLELQGITAANSSCLQQVAGPGWAALGDAAISFDPLSSQGIFNAMASALQLTDLIQDHDIINNSDKAAYQFERIYTQQVNQIWLHYLQHKDLFYRQEMRWKAQPFWQRRHANQS